MAESFQTLGAGNGFSSCLKVRDVNTDFGITVFNPPSLEQTMSAYWNFKSVSWEGATFEPGNKPKDLICNPSANSGGAYNGSDGANQSGLYVVGNGLPSIYVENEVNYYAHGISMSFSAMNSSALEGAEQNSRVSVVYRPTIYPKANDLSSYKCVNITFGEPPNPDIIGKSALEKTQDVSSVIISGIPFIKIVEKSFGGTFYNGSSGPCPLANYPSIPGDPTLELHTY
tara:strand:+ start:456 stop:1139 length:684 start_codon:yes stop_codon:yes gene_type:complete